MKRLLFIINPKAGRTAIRNDLFEIIMVFSQAGYEVVTYPTQGPEDAERKVRVDGEDYDLIVCAGGDGTLDNTVCGYSKMGHKKCRLVISRLERQTISHEAFVSQENPLKRQIRL